MTQVTEVIKDAPTTNTTQTQRAPPSPPSKKQFVSTAYMKRHIVLTIHIII